MLQSLVSIRDEQLQKIKAVFFDIDDTFSGGNSNDHGFEARIGSDAFSALWKLHQKGIKLFPVTGRPAGWCDLIARMFPVDGIVGENGAFYLTLQSAGHGKPSVLVKKYLESEDVRKKNSKKLEVLKKIIFRKFPKAETPSDQNYREFDLAIDYCEDVKRWSEDQIQKLIELCQQQKAQVKLSSIHLNIWFGKYDKASCVRKVMKDILKLNPEKDRDQIVYLGDSPNDEPFFEMLPFTVGVANILNFISKMKFHPTFVTSLPSGAGFAEFAELLLKHK